MTKSVHTPRYRNFLRILVDARDKAGLSQAEVAERLSRPQSYVSKYENAERRLDVIEFLDIAKAIGFDPAEAVKKLSNS